MLRKGILLLLLVWVLAACTTPARLPMAETTVAAGTNDELVLAAGTTLVDSGLLDAILPDFERKTGIIVRVLALSTEQALALGHARDADVLLVHDPVREEAFVAAGDAPGRFAVMYNDFVLVGPPEDPAHVRGMTSASAALARVAAAAAPFISRGDGSGTHARELQLWALAGLQPEGAWYERSGQGMAETLSVADERLAYTLSDRATFLVRKLHDLNLDLLVEGDPLLRNQYSVLPVLPTAADKTNYGGATAFATWITSADTQALIAAFGLDTFNQQLYYPNP